METMNHLSAVERRPRRGHIAKFMTYLMEQCLPSGASSAEMARGYAIGGVVLGITCGTKFRNV
jgi:hypothetical protein